MKRNASTTRPGSALPPQGSKVRPTSVNKKPDLALVGGSMNNLAPIDPFSTSNKSGFQQQRSVPFGATTESQSQFKSKSIRIKKTPKATNERKPFEEINIASSNPSQFPSLNLTSPSYRFIQPTAQKIDISQRLWVEAVEKSTGLVANPLASPQSQLNIRPKSGLATTQERFRAESREGSEYGLYQMGSVGTQSNENAGEEARGLGSMKPFSFLSNVGGKQTNLSEIMGEGPVNKRPNTGVPMSRRPMKEGEDISIFVNSNVDKTEKVKEKKPKTERPQTVNVNTLIQRTESAQSMKTTKQIIIRATKPPVTGEEISGKRPMTAQVADTKLMRKSQSANIRISTAKGRLMSANLQSAQRRGEGLSKGPSKDIGEPEEFQDEFDSLGIQEDLEDDDEVYRKMEIAKNLKKTSQSRMFSSSRPISGIRAAPDEFFANFAKFSNFAELENVYEELFDRNERTLAATFAKFGDLGYYSPLQRIGSYIQYSAKLKKVHLDEIIDFLKTVTTVEKPEYEIPIQLAIIDELDPYQNRQKTGISTTFQVEDITREPLTLSLYPEYIEVTKLLDDMENVEMEGTTASQMAAQKYFEHMIDQMNGNYDPEHLGRDNFLYIPQEQWPKNIRDRVILSFKRYNHYIHSDEIKHDEISKYKKEWITNALSLVPEYLLKTYEESVRRMFQEIFENYKIAMKEAIVNYILLNPDERKRLNITLLLQHVPCSAERIAKEGGFSRKLYPAWHEFVTQGKEDTKNHSHQLGVVTSAVLDWYEDFSQLSLFEHTAIKESAAKGFTLDIPSFKRLEDSYRYRTISLLRNVFYRGVVLILKKGKHLRRKQYIQGRWDYTGFKTRNQIAAANQMEIHYEEHLTDPSNLSFRGDYDTKTQESAQFYNELYQKIDLECNFKDKFDFFEDIQQLEELLDIRETPAYRVYSVLTDKPLHLQENLYKLLSKEDRKSLRCSVGFQVSLLLRKLIEKAVEQFAAFFGNISTLGEIEETLSHMKPSGTRLSLDIEEEKPGKEKDRLIREQALKGQIKAGDDTLRSKAAVGTKQDVSARNKQNLTSVVNLEKMELIKPDFMYYQSALFPVLRIDMIFEEGALKFKETEEYIKSEIGSLYRGIVEALDGLLHPEYTKIEVKNQIQGVQDDKKDETNLSAAAAQIEGEKRRMTIGAEEIAYSKTAEDIYSKFCDIVILKEKPPKKKVVAFGLKEETEPENQVPKHLKITDMEEDFFMNIFEETIDHITNHYAECQQSFQIFDQFKPFFTKAIDKEIKTLFAKKNFVLEEYRTYLIVLKNFEDLLNQVPNNIYFPMFEVNCELVKHHLENSIEDLKNKIFNRLESNIIDQFRSISEKYSSNVAYIRRDTDTPEEVEQMEKFIYDMNFDRIHMKTRASEAFRGLLALFKLEHMGSDLLQNLAKEVHEWPGNLDKELKSAEEKHNVQRLRLEEKLRERRANFENRVIVYSDDLEQYTNFTEYTSYKKYIEEITEFENLLNQAEREMYEIQDHEKKLFGIVSVYDKFVGLKKTLEPYVEFWNTVGEFLEAKRAWMHGPFKQVNPIDVETSVKTHIKSSNKLSKMFDKNPIAGRLASEFREDVQSISEMLPVIEVLCNPGLKERHWVQIEEMIHAKFNPDEGSLKEVLAKGVNAHLEQIEELSEQASKEFKMESMLEKMEKEWENLRFVVTIWKNTNVLILQGAALEDIMLVLDDHTLKAQTIRSNPNIKFMEERAIRWEKLMLFIQEVLDVWIKVQSSYLYLEPIFGSEDIIGQMPKEAKKFSEVDSAWKDIMIYVERDPLVLHVENIPRLLERLNNSLNQIEEIQKGLNDYLERKRLDFPRFFFLSNEDLLNILAETKDPLLVQPHLKKCFEGINELIFSSNVEILGMRSSEGEEINFLEKISPKNYKSNVEQWLGKVEEQMKLSLQKSTEDSLNDLTKTRIPRTEWVIKWPGQVVICISQTLWTFTVEDKLKTSGLEGIKNYNDELKVQLEDIVALVRGNLTNLERITLGALIVIEVHARDVVNDLVHDRVTEKEAFEWISQLRYYWEATDKRINVKMITSSMDFGYEYLGNTGRLVITPLTDRCYRTLMSALQLNLGGAPEGPAGTGKTETTKDLAKALAMQCVVFNCSEGLNSHAMAKFFKGLASAGAWSCFDEFNRIELEVLSVVAQQILEIQQAKNLGKRQFLFAGTQLELKPSCNVFITMNPGYAGRSELPDNLKALFRPVAMMVPDYAMIAEISLYSYGFDQARDLARKIVATYKLCSEQLSSQDHYDYGMRAVKAVLTTAGQLKRKFVQEKEDTLMLRSICDVNLPKFLTQDIQLFMGIISDLFPSVKAPQVDYGVLNDTITAAMQKYKLQNVANFRKKIFQLYEMVNCRHGLMLVGQPFSGKTMCYRVLAKAMTDAAATGESEEVPTYYHVINPKSLTIAQLYGYSDPISKEWTEGVLAEIFRKCATMTTPDRQWIVFDGPVDADWIENMNTVLDDNKKLCLMNGETIAMSNPMTMMFEVADLLQASPATVSRCGMIYMQPDNIGWWPLVQSWTMQFEQIFESSFLKHLEDLFDAIFGKCLEFIKSKCFEYQAVPEGNLVVSTMRLMQAFMNQHDMLSLEGISRLKPEDMISRMDQLFLYCIIWSVGATTNDAGRKLFGTFFKKLIGDTIKCDHHKDRLLKLDKAALLPEGTGTVPQDYYLEDWKWKNWKERLDKMEVTISEDMKYHDIVVPTTESLRITSFLKIAIASEFPFLLIGPTGTGKSLFIGNHLKTLSLETNLIIFVTFSAQTTSTQTQEIIDEKMEKVRKGIYGPGFGKKCLIFIDDLNMPAYDKYGAQPPIELLRQYFDHHGWYDRKDRKFREIIETNLLAAMGPPGGGRNVITPRLLRHFYVYATTEADDKTFVRIFNKIIDWHLAKQGLDQETGKMLRFAVEGSIEVYTQVCENLKPTPAKSHYLFNLRDLSRVVQGMLLLGKAQSNDSKKLVRLWMHEVCRVFYDRLTTEADQDWFFNLLSHTTKAKLRENDLKALFKPLVQDETKLSLMINSHEVLKYLRFGDIMGDEINAHERPYDEIKDQPALQKRIEKFMEEYNESTKKPMNLVMFEFAIDHILRICRLLKMARSHALLVGLGGSGRQSLTRIAAFICEHEVFTVEVSKSYTFDQWRNDIKRLLISAGVDLKYYVFLITDRHIVGDYVLEDLNNLLNSGDVPNCIPQEEFLPLIDKLRMQARQEGKEDLYNSGTNSQFYDFFVENVKAHLHLVLVQSSIGDALRTRMRMFPSIVNCCTCIWYKPWPDEALHAVAQKFMHDLGVDVAMQRGMVNSVKFMHESVKKLSAEYLKAEGRHNYITPTSYLELLSSLKSLLETQKKKLGTRLESYDKGVEKLMQTAEEVKKMERELTDKRPVLIQMKEENTKLAATIEANIVEMEPKRIQVEKEEAYVNSRVQEAEVIRQDCQNELSQALPLVEKAKKALQNIDPNDIINLRSMLKPPVTVQLVLEAVCVLLKEAPQKVTNPENPKEKIDNYWEKSKKLLSDYKAFLDRLLGYKINEIDEAIMEKVRKNYLSRTADFNPTRVEKASSAAKGLCEWVIALSKYEKVLAIVRPKQREYDKANAEVEALKKSLKEKTDELAILNAQIRDLQDKYQQTRQKQAELEEDIDICQKKLDRAQILTGSLGGEKDRWSEAVKEYNDKLRYVVGDVLLSAGIISYLGPFSSMYRARIQKEWIDMVKQNHIQVNSHYSLENSLGEPILIRKWTINGLPSDNFSRENGIIIDNAGRYSLMIDPQNQANKWIKNNEMDNELRVVKQSDSDFIKTLENAVTFGWVLLIENIHEELDAILEPILMKQTFKNAGVLSIRIGENIVDYNKSFRLFMTTKLRNPHYAPEVSIKITLVNFMITKEGLDDQLLEIAVAKENPDLEEQRSKLIVQSHENQQQLEEIENKILNILRTSQGNILNDEEAINVLAQSKEISTDIEEKQKAAEVTEKKIEEARTGYKAIAVHSRVLFFALMGLSNIEVVYQYSLTWFIQLFLNAFNQAERSPFLLQRVNNVIDTLTYSVYNNVCRSLFEKDKLLFSFVLTHAVLENKGKINPLEFNFFISPPASSLNANIPPNPLSWLPATSWIRFHDLSKVTDYFKDITRSLEQEEAKWKEIYEDQEAHKKTFPAPFQTCSHMQRLCILKVLRPDRVIGAIREFITSEMSAKFITPPTFDMARSFSESIASQPLIFILPGTDPMSLLMSFAEQHGKANTLQKISLGQGQGPIAERAIKEARESAGWVILQNCHLAPSWMPELEKICEFLESKAGKEKTHPSFRLWLTTYPSQDFPVSILQSSVKMTNEPPKGLKNNMMVSYMSDPISHVSEFYETNSKPKEFKNLLFGLCMFHAVIQERRNYGALGWNIYYDFNQSDLRISVKQLHLFLDQYKGIPFKALHYLTGECNYGGRVTDDRDRRILKALMQEFFSEKVLQNKYQFVGLPAFSLPDTNSYDNVLKYLENMPLVAPPELFGFHSNAEISKDLKETNEMCYNLLLIGGGSQTRAKEGESDEAKLKKICEDLLGKIPKEFNPEIVKAKFPVSYNNSMNTVLNQEIIRYNRLTSTITSSLKNIDQALKGLQVMSEQLEKITQSLLRGLVPDMWKRKSYPSLKPLASYIHDLTQRLAYFQKWIDRGYPNVYWISGFFFTQSFLTGVLQNYARKNTIPIDNLTFDFEFLEEPTDTGTLDERYQAPEEGCYIYGLFLEGCRWDYETQKLEESYMKVLYSLAPIIWLRPIEQSEIRDYPHYKCPVYKTTERKGTLSTTGHSTNFIMIVNVDSDREESHWIKRGVAMICQLSD